MKRIIIILFLLLSFKGYAANYYVKTGGSDSGDGLSDASAWGTISKVNSFWAAGSFAPGDHILFKCGDIFKGTIIVTESGTTGNPIVIGAYGTGAKPVISGFTEITGWTTETGGIYSKAITVQSTPNLVTVNGVNTPLGRYPDTGYLTIDSHSTNTTISDAELNSYTTNWTGAQVVIRKNDFIIDRNLITAHSGNTLTYKSSTDYEAADGWGYFIQNDLKTLTSPNEWYYSSGKFFMFFGTATPSTRVVKVSTVDKLIVMDRKDNVTIENLYLQGANVAAISANAVNRVTIQNCDFNYSGFDAIYLNGTSSYFSIKGCTFNHTNSIVLSGEYLSIQNHTYFGHNVVKNTGTLVGMFRDYGGACAICENLPSHSLYEFNSIDSTGYIPIRFTGDSSIVRNNYINYFCSVKDDGGGIYTYSGNDSVQFQQRLVMANIVTNAAGAPTGRNAPTPAESVGIYMDNNSSDVKITGNTVAFCGTGILLNGAHEITMRNNTLYNNKLGFEMAVHTAQPAYKNTFNNNLVARTSSVLVKQNSTNIIDVQNVQIQFSFPATFYTFGALDSNYYSGPDDNSFLFINRNLYNGAVLRTFNDWKTFTSKESKSAVFPISTRFDFNSTSSPKTITLSASYKDVKGVIYSNSYVLQPYSSAVLMPYSGTIPVIPSCISSTIENPAPSVIDMTFDLTLASIVPVPSAFTITVNSNPRTVKSVAISGSHVLLTLDSPVIYGDVVTLTYTEPSTNKLQGTSGGIVPSMTNRQVANNVSAPMPVFVSSVIQNSSPNIVEITYNMNLAAIVPATSAFNVSISSVVQPVNTVTISGSKVLLTLANPVSYGNVVTFAYTKPATNPLQSTSGQQAATTGTLNVTNNVASVQAVIPEYVSSVVQNSSPNIVEITYNMNLAAIVPANSAFSVSINSVVQSINTVTISGSKVLLTLANPVAYVNVVTFAYTKPSVNPLQSTSGGQAASTGMLSVTNNVVNVQPEIPIYVSSIVQTSTPDILEITFSTNLDNIVPSSSAFNIAVNSVNRTVDMVTITGTKVLLKLSSQVFHGDIITLSYNKPSINPLQSDSGGQASSISLMPVTNKVRSINSRKKGITIYPNPATESINISTADTSPGINSVSIYEMTGKLCLQTRVDPSMNDIHIPLNNLKSGIYIVHLNYGSLTIFSQQIIVN